MPADKISHRTEPSFGTPATVGASPEAKVKRTLSSEFRVIPADRAEPSLYANHAPTADNERSRAPLSTDPDAQRAERRAQRAATRGGILGPVVTIASVALLAGVVAFRFPEYLPASVTALWGHSAPTVREVASTAMTPSLTPFTPTTETLTGATPARPAPSGPAYVSPPKIDDTPQDIGTARLATPPVSNTKSAPVAARSPEKETNLALATQGMKAVEPPPQAAQPQPQAPEKPAAQPSKSEPQPAPKAAAKAAPPAPAAQPVAPQPKAQTQPKAQPKAAPEDFLAMVNGALKGGTPAAASANSPEEASAAGQLVQSVQEKLRDRGYDPGSVDGRAGTKTTEAIRSFQRSAGMAPNGQIDMALMEKLGIVGKQLQFPTR